MQPEEDTPRQFFQCPHCGQHGSVPEAVLAEALAESPFVRINCTNCQGRFSLDEGAPTGDAGGSATGPTDAPLPDWLSLPETKPLDILPPETSETETSEPEIPETETSEPDLSQATIPEAEVPSAEPPQEAPEARETFEPLEPEDAEQPNDSPPFVPPETATDTTYQDTTYQDTSDPDTADQNTEEQIGEPTYLQSPDISDRPAAFGPLHFLMLIAAIGFFLAGLYILGGG